MSPLDGPSPHPRSRSRYGPKEALKMHRASDPLGCLLGHPPGLIPEKDQIFLFILFYNTAPPPAFVFPPSISVAFSLGIAHLQNKCMAGRARRCSPSSPCFDVLVSLSMGRCSTSSRRLFQIPRVHSFSGVSSITYHPYNTLSRLDRGLLLPAFSGGFVRAPPSDWTFSLLATQWHSRTHARWPPASTTRFDSVRGTTAPTGPFFFVPCCKRFSFCEVFADLAFPTITGTWRPAAARVAGSLSYPIKGGSVNPAVSSFNQSTFVLRPGSFRLVKVNSVEMCVRRF